MDISLIQAHRFASDDLYQDQGVCVCVRLQDLQFGLHLIACADVHFENIFSSKNMTYFEPFVPHQINKICQKWFNALCYKYTKYIMQNLENKWINHINWEKNS